MCRFLLVKSRTSISPKQFLISFSQMARNSRSYDGDWQGDGWGISWLQNNLWQTQKFLSPVWEDSWVFANFPPTTLFSVHARSASFPSHKGNIEYNQPFIDKSYSFVFNGLLKGVSLSSDLPGDIGAQKIWFLLKKLLRRLPPDQALEKIKQIILKNSHQIQALNIGLSDQENIYALNFYSSHLGYYQLYCLKQNDIQIICSEKLTGEYKFKKITPNSVIKL